MKCWQTLEYNLINVFFNKEAIFYCLSYAVFVYDLSGKKEEEKNRKRDDKRTEAFL